MSCFDFVNLFCGLDKSNLVRTVIKVPDQQLLSIFIVKYRFLCCVLFVKSNGNTNDTIIFFLFVTSLMWVGCIKSGWFGDKGV